METISKATQHDRLVKNLIKLFMPDLLYLFLPDLAADVDLRRITWLDKESFTDLRDGQRAVADLVAGVQTLGGGGELVLHIEIEREFRRATAERLEAYYHHLWLQYRLPVLTLVLYLQGGDAGLRECLRLGPVGHLDLNPFRYYACGLQGCSPEEFCGRRQPLAWALAAFMRPRVWSRVRHKFEILRRIHACQISERRKGVLVNIAHTYLQLSPEEEMELREMIEQEYDYDELRASRPEDLTWFDKVWLQGHEDGQRETLLETLRDLLEVKFGSLPAAVVRRLEAIQDSTVLQGLTRRVLQATSLSDMGLDEQGSPG